MKLRDYVATEPTIQSLRAKVEWREGITFTLAYMSRTVLTQVADENRKFVFNESTKRRESQLDLEGFSKALAHRMILDWEGVTIAALSKLMPLKPGSISADELNAPIPYTVENVVDLLSGCPGLDDFLTNTCTDISVFQSAKTIARDETAAKNSLPLPSTT